jgi:D,D-heptose 1,7-bisphosphate phosphatase
MALNSIKRRAIFFDKDGTLIEDIPYNVNPDKIKFLPGAEEAIQRLSPYFEFVIVSNQAGVALGFFEENELLNVKKKLGEMFSGLSVNLKDFYYCPHYPFGHLHEYSVSCECRKPGSKMLERAALEHHFEITDSWMIGDILDDIEAGNRADCFTILIDNGHETEWREGPFRKPDFVVKNLFQAADLILKETLVEEWF